MTLVPSQKYTDCAVLAQKQDESCGIQNPMACFTQLPKVQTFVKIDLKCTDFKKICTDCVVLAQKLEKSCWFQKSHGWVASNKIDRLRHIADWHNNPKSKPVLKRLLKLMLVLIETEVTYIENNCYKLIKKNA